MTQNPPKIAANLNTNFLKLLAIISMSFDHFGKAFFPDIIWFPIIGRLAFPIFAYCIVVGCLYTHDFKGYITRLGAFAVLSQPIYVLAHYPSWQGLVDNLWNFNILFTLILGAFAVQGLKEKNWLMFAISLAIVSFFNFDYGINGILLMMMFFIFREKPYISILACTVMLGSAFLSPDPDGLNLFGRMVDIQGFAVLALIPIFIKTNFKININKYFFYAFYPAHLLAIFLIRLAIGG
ncbi:MAG: TraX family protein [Oscillospiraceae bacterium]